MHEQSPQRRLFFLIAAIAGGIIVYDVLKQSFMAVLFPFATAYVAAKLVRPLGVWFSRAARIREKTGCTIFGVLVCGASVLGLTRLSAVLWAGMRNVSEQLPMYTAEAAERITSLAKNAAEHLPFLHTQNPQIGTIVTGALREAASKVGGAAAGVIGNALSGFSGGVFSVFIGVIAFLYLIADPAGVRKSIRALLRCFANEEVVQRILHVFARVGDSVFMYLRSYLILAMATFVQLFIGFLVIGVDNAPVSAFLIALIDALPLLGCGIVLVPWAIWCFLEGNLRRGIALLILEMVVYVVRQFLEPKIIGRMTGVHPFVALLVLFAGLKIGGVTGMILAPVILMSVMRLKDN